MLPGRSSDMALARLILRMMNWATYLPDIWGFSWHRPENRCSGRPASLNLPTEFTKNIKINHLVVDYNTKFGPEDRILA